MNLKDTYTKVFLRAAGNEFDEKSFDHHKKTWWYNLRTNTTTSLRLTDEGYDFILNKAQLKTYKIDFPKEFTITPQVLLWLDKYIESPYYIDKKSITVFREKSAFELYLFSGDIKKLGYSKALAKRFTQDSLVD